MEGTLLIWIVIVSYYAILRHKRSDKRKKISFAETTLLLLTGAMSLLIALHFDLEGVVEIINNTLGQITKSVVSG